MSLLIALMIGQASALACDAPQTQMEMNACTEQEFQAADAELNAQWTIARAAMRQNDTEFSSSWDRRPGYFDQLLAAQRAWIAFRDAHCASEGYRARGGSLEPMLVAGCKTDLTKARTTQLRQLAREW